MRETSKTCRTAIYAALSAAGLLTSTVWAIHPATARVYVTDGITQEGMQQSIGSGILVAPGILATNWHVIEGSQGTIITKFLNGQIGQGQVLASNRTWDVALVSTGPVLVSPIPLGPPPQIGEQLELAGFGKNGVPIAHMGRVLGYKDATGDNQRAWLAISSPSRIGDSGGPSIDMQGRLAGLIWGTDGSETVAVRSGAIRYLLTQCSTGQCPPGQCPTPAYRNVPSPTYGAPAYAPQRPRVAPRQPRMPPAAPKPDWLEGTTLGVEDLLGAMPGPVGTYEKPAPVKPKVNTTPAFTIRTGLDKDLKSLFNRDDILNEQQRLLMQVQSNRRLIEIRDSLGRIENLLGAKPEPKGVLQ